MLDSKSVELFMNNLKQYNFIVEEWTVDCSNSLRRFVKSGEMPIKTDDS